MLDGFPNSLIIADYGLLMNFQHNEGLIISQNASLNAS